MQRCKDFNHGEERQGDESVNSCLPQHHDLPEVPKQPEPDGWEMVVCHVAGTFSPPCCLVFVRQNRQSWVPGPLRLLPLWNRGWHTHTHTHLTNSWVSHGAQPKGEESVNSSLTKHHDLPGMTWNSLTSMARHSCKSHFVIAGTSVRRPGLISSDHCRELC